MPMSAQPPAPSQPDPGDPIGVRYPNTARIWNYQLGGKDNFAVDRQASQAANAMVSGLGVPAGADTAVESRHLLQRMVDYMLGQGVRQFLDLGSGLPNMASTHHIAHRVTPGARIVYADIDPMVSAQAAALIACPNVVTLRADLREPEQVLSDPRVRDLLDFGQPVGITLMCALHCLWDRQDPWGSPAVPGRRGPGQLPGPQPHDRRSPPRSGRWALPDDPGPALEHAAHLAEPCRHHPILQRVHAGPARPGASCTMETRPDDSLRIRREHDGDDEPVLQLFLPELPEDDRGPRGICAGSASRTSPPIPPPASAGPCGPSRPRSRTSPGRPPLARPGTPP